MNPFLIFYTKKQKLNYWAGKGNVKALSKSLVNGEYEIRKKAAQYLSSIKDTDVVPVLIESLEDKSYSVYYWSVIGLEQFKLNDDQIRKLDFFKKQWTLYFENQKATASKHKHVMDIIQQKQFEKKGMMKDLRKSGMMSIGVGRGRLT